MAYPHQQYTSHFPSGEPLPPLVPMDRPRSNAVVEPGFPHSYWQIASTCSCPIWENVVCDHRFDWAVLSRIYDGVGFMHLRHHLPEAERMAMLDRLVASRKRLEVLGLIKVWEGFDRIQKSSATVKADVWDRAMRPCPVERALTEVQNILCDSQTRQEV